jgi:hypothetical protein
MLALMWARQVQKSTMLGIDFCVVSHPILKTFQDYQTNPSLLDHNIRIMEDELRAMNQTSIPLHDGSGYQGMMAVFHELHCLVCFLFSFLSHLTS